LRLNRLGGADFCIGATNPKFRDCRTVELVTPLAGQPAKMLAPVSQMRTASFEVT
jgi:hypothetical protein